MTARPRRRSGHQRTHLICLRTMERTYDQLVILLGRLDLPGTLRAEIRNILPPLEQYLISADYLPHSDEPLIG